MQAGKKLSQNSEKNSLKLRGFLQPRKSQINATEVSCRNGLVETPVKGPQAIPESGGKYPPAFFFFYIKSHILQVLKIGPVPVQLLTQTAKR